jgi:hypothetical protein
MKQLTLINRYQQTQERPKPPGHLQVSKFGNAGLKNEIYHLEKPQSITKNNLKYKNKSVKI